MTAFHPISAFLDSTCFSLLYPIFHNPNPGHMETPLPLPHQSHLSYRNAQSKYQVPQLQPKRPIRINNMGIASQTNLLWAAFAQLPHYSMSPEHLGAALVKELKPHTLTADDDFIDTMFSPSHCPLTVPDTIALAALSKPIGQKPALWDQANYILKMLEYKKKDLAEWLNQMGEYLEQLIGHKPLH
ncbi:hypothetical protein L208DRAFT_1379346 [Tricholoma matsutake]|nr:hypothetical protein L208DRAFT_1379346 [Tricholoma matsutake 945]